MPGARATGLFGAVFENDCEYDRAGKWKAMHIGDLCRAST